MFPWREKDGRLGPLESELLRLLWHRGSGTVREIVESGDIKAAYTTIMTTLDRLHKKGLLVRVGEGRAYRYSPRQTQQQFRGAALQSAVRDILLTADRSHVPLSFLVDAVSEHDRALLDDLQREIERKRRELDEKERG